MVDYLHHAGRFITVSPHYGYPPALVTPAIKILSPLPLWLTFRTCCEKTSEI